MHVLQLCHSYYPPFLDCARQYASLFKGSAIKVTTVYLQGSYDEQVVEGSDSDTVIFLGHQSHQMSGLKLGIIAEIKKLAASRPFLFCITHRVKPTYVALLATRLPIISVHHNYNDYQKWSRRWLVNCFRQRILMLGVSDSVTADLKRDLKHWSQSSILTFYNHIDVAAVQALLLSKTQARQALGLPQGAFIFGNVGRLHHDKDQLTLIRAFAKAFPRLAGPAMLCIIGSGPLETVLKDEVNRLQLAHVVLFLGQITDAKRYFKAFDVFVLSSDHEPFGMVLLEAMAAEVPIFCANTGGGAEVVKDAGFLFTQGNSAELANLMMNVSQGQCQLCLQKQSQKLVTYFSDQAAQRHFMRLPFTQSLLSQHLSTHGD